MPAKDQCSSCTTSAAGEIVARIQSGEWTAAQVLEAYIARAVVAQRRTNCLTEIMFEPARERAAALDREFAMTKKLVGPLHGVPISIKDTCECAHTTVWTR
jgi:Asp-tRNA(Asn)/Glu-tRNA(Gln) amidotransferase A subunit family amidase